MARQAAKFVTEHPYLSSGINSAAAFVLGVFVKEPLERWLRGVGKLKQTRNAMYVALADVLTEVELFLKGLDRVLSLNNPAVEEYEVTRLINIFYEQMKTRDYSRELTALRATRASIADQVEGFERVSIIRSKCRVRRNQ